MVLVLPQHFLQSAPLGLAAGPTVFLASAGYFYLPLLAAHTHRCAPVAFHRRHSLPTAATSQYINSFPLLRLVATRSSSHTPVYARPIYTSWTDGHGFCFDKRPYSSLNCYGDDLRRGCLMSATIRHTSFDCFDMCPYSSVNTAPCCTSAVHSMYCTTVTYFMYTSLVAYCLSVLFIVSSVFLFTILLYPSRLYCCVILLLHSYVVIVSLFC